MGTIMAGMSTPIDGPVVVTLGAADSESEVAAERDVVELVEGSAAFDPGVYDK